MLEEVSALAPRLFSPVRIIPSPLAQVTIDTEHLEVRFIQCSVGVAVARFYMINVDLNVLPLGSASLALPTSFF